MVEAVFGILYPAVKAIASPESSKPVAVTERLVFEDMSTVVR